MNRDLNRLTPFILAALGAGALVGCERMEPPQFDFAHIDSRGQTLAAGAEATCLHDRRTGLTWEVKTQSGLRAADNTYTWFNPDKESNNGHAGAANGGKCAGSDCDTLSYVRAVNAEKLCGFSDWRLPRREELGSLVDFAVPFPGPTVPKELRPTMRPASYWTGSVFKPHYTGVWAWRFDHGYDHVAQKDEGLHILAVRGELIQPKPAP